VICGEILSILNSSLWEGIVVRLGRILPTFILSFLNLTITGETKRNLSDSNSVPPLTAAMLREVNLFLNCRYFFQIYKRTEVTFVGGIVIFIGVFANKNYNSPSRVTSVRI